jgi:2-polyprenyl-6-methoxyphenol hydroxylase-like FAD-dependent oxidoreductase
LLGLLTKACCPRVNYRAVDFHGSRIAGSIPPLNGESETICVSRGFFETVLLEAARGAGVEVRENFTVQELVGDQSGITGLRGLTAGGELCNEKARVVIGADGAHSFVARLVDPEEYRVVEPLTCCFWSYWSGVPVAGTELVVRARCGIFAAPAGDGLTVIRLWRPRSEFRRMRSDPESGFREALEMSAMTGQLMGAARREADFAGAASPTNLFRRPFGPGWALVGDAGYYRDSITLQGVTDALRDAELLSSAVARGLIHDQSTEEALAEYQWKRDQAAMPMYSFTCELARLGSFAEEHRVLLEQLRGNKTETERFLGVLAGTVPMREFYDTKKLSSKCGQGLRAPKNS